MKLRMEDGTMVDPERARESWSEGQYWNGHNWISKHTGDQWTHETLYLSSKGRYYVVTESQWQGVENRAEYVSELEAAKWLMLAEKDLPEDLLKYAEEVVE